MPDRPAYQDIMTAVGLLMNAHEADLRGGRTTELRAATSHAYAEVAQLVYDATDRPARPVEPEWDPKLPIRRDLRKA